MLTYFPTPYPGEWWYSVLCRYHVRSGNAKQQTTVRELFPGRMTAAIGSVFPNSTIRQVISQLPSGILDIESVIQEHTLFSYFERFHSFAEKKTVLSRLCLGETVVITSIRKVSKLLEWRPQYCPRCFEEDRQTYGEAYWHVEHQIPLMTCCPVHGCRLMQAEHIQASHLAYTFYPLDGLEPLQQPESAANSWELPLANVLHDYYALPMTAGATPGYSNLALTLSNMGYGVIQKNSRHTILDGKRLYHDLIDFYDSSLVEQVFGGEQSICTINRVCKWEMTSPERYALIQCFANIPSEVVFAPESIKERYEEQLLTLSKTGIRYGKKQLAEQLGITKPQLDILARKYGIKPFWVQNEEKEKGGQNIKFHLDEQELALFKHALAESGFRYDSHFAKHCVLAYMAEHLSGSPDEKAFSDGSVDKRRI